MLKPMHPLDVELIVVHCSGTVPGQDIGAAEITRKHRESGLLTIGYHWVIRRDGVIEPGRSMELPGVHAEGANQRSIGVCFVGGAGGPKCTPEDNFTQEQIEAWYALLQVLRHKFPRAQAVGYRGLPGFKNLPRPF